MVEVALGLGSNLADRTAFLRKAVHLLSKTGQIDIRAVSSIWKTAPWGITDQPEFLNACALIETSLRPDDLLEICAAIEADSGRTRDLRWGPRTIDMDILFYGNMAVKTDRLIIPHPRLLERSFVLAPLEEIAGDFIISGKSVREHLTALPLAGVERASPFPDWRYG